MIRDDTGSYQLTPFRPAWWLRGRHAQTIGGRFLRAAPPLELARERFELSDGDFVDLDHVADPRLPGDAPLALVLHGLEGSARSTYVLHALRELAERGVRGVALNFRGCSGEMNRLPRFYHAGDTGDLHEVLSRLRAESGRTVGAIGFSLGGNILLKYLGERGADAGDMVAGAAAISVPFDLSRGADELERGMGRVYTRYFMRKLTRKALEKARLVGALESAEPVRRARTVRQFDDLATAPLHGFRDAEEYYHSSSSTRFLHGIRVPTLVLHALDDPFLPRAEVPVAAIRENPALVDGVTERGGHVGFVSGSPRAPVFWAEREAARFVAHCLAADLAAGRLTIGERQT